MSNDKCQMTNAERRGFSLIEILVVLSIFVVIAVIANQVFFSTLRGGSKSEATTLVKQEGNYAISVIERGLQSAQSVTSACNDPGAPSMCTDSNGRSFPCINYLDSTGTASSFSCEPVDSPTYIASGSARLTTDRVTIVPNSCKFYCFKEGGVATVSAEFTLQRSETDLTTREQTQLDFKTRILLRN